MDVIGQTREFVKNSFIEKPHYSFNDWTVMYNHSITVEEMAMLISKDMEADLIVIAISALLHDIGKIYEADDETLKEKHEKFNFIVSKEFLESLDLTKEQLDKIKETILGENDTIERKIIKDADALAFFKDKTLHILFFKWANEIKRQDYIEKKLNKFSKLNFDTSKKIGKKWFKEMKREWAY